MPKLGEMFPSNYLRADDFEDGEQVLTIERIEEERMGQGKDAKDVYVLFFRKTKKGLVLNKTNSNIIGALYGEDTDDWIGKAVTLYATEVQFQDKMVDAIRIRSKAPKAVPGKAKVASPAREPGDDDDETGVDAPF